VGSNKVLLDGPPTTPLAPNPRMVRRRKKTACKMKRGSRRICGPRKMEAETTRAACGCSLTVHRVDKIKINNCIHRQFVRLTGLRHVGGSVCEPVNHDGKCVVRPVHDRRERSLEPSNNGGPGMGEPTRNYRVIIVHLLRMRINWGPRRELSTDRRLDGLHPGNTRFGARLRLSEEEEY
jgi:hypothetical protein